MHNDQMSNSGGGVQKRLKNYLFFSCKDKLG